MKAPQRIAVLSLACRFPDAKTPEELWRNVLDGHRSFRMLPTERLCLDAYRPERVGEALSITPILAGLITDWEFDRTRFRVPKRSFEAADLVHWLALETASNALASIAPDMLPRERTAVILGNTLTGEFSRAAQVHLRLPYLQSKLTDALAQAGADKHLTDTAVSALHQAVATDFSLPTEETLAGGLANTIAGRIANHLDLHGGAWTVDGACAASLLAIVDACTRLQDGTLEAALVGGVDLSLDPFELVGFSRNGALARDQMRVFDRRASGFWPGEGCGMALLAPEHSALAKHHEPLAYLAGWGVSTDGAGGLTRPTVSGQALALRRAYARARIDPQEVGYVEAHGTGTAVGDPTEVEALAEVLGSRERRLPIGSIKANIGHTKAAAGIAGLIKTVMGIHQGIVPPHVSCEEPHPVFAQTAGRVHPTRTASPWATHGDAGRVGGVSGFGFGGVN
ncbi:MAG: polyketide synthase, partial [Pseudomonadota bacterium]